MATHQIEFADNQFLVALFGSQNSHLNFIESHLDITITSRGNELTLVGKDKRLRIADAAISALFERAQLGHDILMADVEAALRIAESQAIVQPKKKSKKKVMTQESQAVRQVMTDTFLIISPKKKVFPRSETQASYIRALQKDQLVFGLGPAGTGKTYLAVAAAVGALMRGEVKRIILTRPAVEAGERLGFLPGDMREKVDPYLRPLYDALDDLLGAELAQKKFERGEIEIAPLAFMRGRTLSDAFVILDEAQNTTNMQMKMFLTRLGEGSQMAVNGDLSQVDLPSGVPSGLRTAIHILKNVTGISQVEFQESDVVRHPLVGRIIAAYNRDDAARKTVEADKAKGSHSGA